MKRIIAIVILMAMFISYVGSILSVFESQKKDIGYFNILSNDEKKYFSIIQNKKTMFVNNESGNKTDDEYKTDIVETAPKEKEDKITYIMPKNNGFKSFMSYKKITDKTSSQLKLQSIAYTGTYGIRMVNDRYCIALGTAFNVEIGDCVDLILHNGTVIECVIGDIKDDKHTKSDNITTAANGCVSEFIVDYNRLSEKVKIMGDISHNNDLWKSAVKEVVIYEGRNLLND